MILTPSKRPDHLKKYRAVRNNNTSVNKFFDNENSTVYTIRYYDTDVITEVIEENESKGYEDLTIFNTGGWQTTNTMLRMNNYLDLVFPTMGWWVTSSAWEFSLRRIVRLRSGRQIITQIPFNLESCGEFCSDRRFFKKLIVSRDFLSYGRPGTKF